MDEKKNLLEQNMSLGSDDARTAEISHTDQKSLFKFAGLFVFGVILFAVFLAFVGKSPLNMMSKTTKPVLNAVGTDMEYEMDSPTPTPMPSIDEVLKKDSTKTEDDVTKDVIMDINDMHYSDMNKDYDTSDLN